MTVFQETRRSGEFLGGCVNLARPERPFGTRESLDHGCLNAARPTPDLALGLVFDSGLPASERVSRRAFESRCRFKRGRFLPLVQECAAWHEAIGQV